MDKVKIATIGLGVMGTVHQTHLKTLSDFEVTAYCDINPEKLKPYQDKAPCYTDYKELLAKADIDAVTIATPHWFHPEIAVAALDAGKHVLVEKPIGVHVKHAMPLLEAIKRHPELKCAAMFNQRNIENHINLKRLIDNGELGAIKRVNWTITNWYRTQRYYDSGDWRASWRGEGGGVLTNQCPHQLDLMQWFFGLPEKVTAFMSFGKYHDIEVEDDVTAYLQYPNGATGVFITTTGEAPGTNRLEIACDRGRVVLENGKLEFLRTEIPVSEHCQHTDGRWGEPPLWNCTVPGENSCATMHKMILENFGKAILHDEPLTACASEGIRGLTLGNAMILSALENKTVTLPLDADLLDQHMKRLVANSNYPKKVVAATDNDDFNASFK